MVFIAVVHKQIDFDCFNAFWTLHVTRWTILIIIHHRVLRFKQSCFERIFTSFVLLLFCKFFRAALLNFFHSSFMTSSLTMLFILFPIDEAFLTLFAKEVGSFGFEEGPSHVKATLRLLLFDERHFSFGRNLAASIWVFEIVLLLWTFFLLFFLSHFHIVGFPDSFFLLDVRLILGIDGFVREVFAFLCTFHGALRLFFLIILPGLGTLLHCLLLRGTELSCRLWQFHPFFVVHESRTALVSFSYQSLNLGLSFE